MLRAGLSLLVAVTAVGCSKSEASSKSSGRDLFAASCARCHGADGSGGLALWDGGPSPRDLRDYGFHAQRTDEQIAQTIRAGKGTGMPAFGATFDDAQIAALVGHVRSLDPQRGR